MLDHRLRRWPNIDPTMGECLMFAGQTEADQTSEEGDGVPFWFFWINLANLGNFKNIKRKRVSRPPVLAYV